MGTGGRQIPFGVVIANGAVYSSSNQRWPSLTWHVGIGCGVRARLCITQRRLSITLLAGAVCLSALSHVAFLATPRAPFGAAGWLWVVSIALVIAAAARQSSAQPPRDSGVEGLSAWSWWEVTIVASITVLA